MRFRSTARGYAFSSTPSSPFRGLSLSWRLGPQEGYKGPHIFIGATITVDVKSLFVRASPMESTEFVNAQVEDKIKKPIFRDIRQYSCKYCRICRSKEALIRSHVLAEHKEKNGGCKGVSGY